MSNAIPPSPPGGPNRRLLVIAQQLIARNNWQLMTAVDLAEQVMAEGMSADQNEKTVQRHMRRIYSEALHSACSGSEGWERQRRGYRELFRYLYLVARVRFPDLADSAEDLAQEALEEIFRRFATAHTPRSFLGWAFWRLRSVVTRLRRQNRDTISLDQPADDSDTSLHDQIPDPQSDPLERVLASDHTARVWQMFDQLMQEHPRAADQFRAVLWKFRDDLDDQQIAARLGLSVKQVHVLRSRGIKKLRERFKRERGDD